MSTTVFCIATTEHQAQDIANNNDSNSKKSLHVQRGIEIDRKEAQELSVLARERSQANNQAREKKLEIDQWQNEEMSRVERDSNPRNR